MIEGNTNDKSPLWVKRKLLNNTTRGYGNSGTAPEMMMSGHILSWLWFQKVSNQLTMLMLTATIQPWNRCSVIGGVGSRQVYLRILASIYSILQSAKKSKETRIRKTPLEVKNKASKQKMWRIWLFGCWKWPITWQGWHWCDADENYGIMFL